MAKKPTVGSMKRQMDEKSVESPQEAQLRDRISTILSEELENADENAPIVVSCGNRGLTLQFVEEPSNYVGHLLQLTNAVRGMHRAIELAQRSGEMANWFQSVLNAALAG